MDMDRDISRRHMLALSAAAGGLAFDGGISRAFAQANTRIEQLAPELDKIIATSEPIKELATGFGGPLGPAEGPLWWKEGGFLLFTDIHNSRRMKHMPGQAPTVDIRAEQSRQRADARSAGPAALVRARHPAGDAARARRQSHRAREQLPGAAAQPAQRRGGQVRRRDLFHRSVEQPGRARAVGPDLRRRLSAHARSRHVEPAGR